MSRLIELITVTPEELLKRINLAIELAVRYHGVDGKHHQLYAMDQVVRALTGCPMQTVNTFDVNGIPYAYEAQGESTEYVKLVDYARDGEDGPFTYDWDVGIAP